MTTVHPASRPLGAALLAAALVVPATATPAVAADAATYYSTKQPYSPAASISSYSQPPAGFTQIYTSSVNRHGSRGLSSFKYDDLAQQMLEDANAKGQLTDLGKRLIPQVEAMIEANEQLTGPGEPGYGNLTAFGRAELRGIGERNAERNNALLKDIDANKLLVKFLSSGQDRAIESGQEFAAGLLSQTQNLEDNLVDGTEDGAVVLEERKDLLYAHKDKQAPGYKAYNDWKDGEVLEAKIDAAYAKPEAQRAAKDLLSKIFAPEFIAALEEESDEPKYVGRNDDSKTVEGIVDAALQFYNLYIISPALQNEAAKPAEGWIFDEYMDDQDGPVFAYLLDVEDYYQKGPAIAGETVAYDNFAPLLDHMIKGVQDRAAGGKVAAEYRFGHAETIIPLAALLKLPGSEKAVPADEVMDYTNSTWRGDKVSPMAANIQWDAFQNEQGTTLVRMLYNEAEVPFHAGCVPVADDSVFYTIEELAACLPLGATSDHSQARPDLDGTDGSSTAGIALAAVAGVIGLLALLGFGAVQLGLIDLTTLPLPQLPF